MAQQQRPGRPGAMTQAMQAAKVSAGPKVLRIGIMQGTKVTEERVIRDRATVTVGTTERNTFTVATQDLPGTFELFPMLGGQYFLNFTDRMEGRVALPEGVKSLADLRQSGAKRTGAGFQVALNEQSRGKVQLGDVTFLFQFVVPPPPQPKPQLPAAIRAGWVKNIDWTYNACLSFFLVMAMSGIAYVEYVYDPIVDDDTALDERFVRLLAQPAAAEEPQEQQADQNQQNQQNQQQAAAAPTPTRQNQPSPAPTAAARAERAANQAASAAAAAERAAQAAMNEIASAQFQALTGALDTGTGSARDNLAGGGLMNASAADLAQTSGVSQGGSGGSRGTGLAANAGGSLGGRTLGAQGTVASSGNTVGSGGEIVRERIIRGNTSVGSGDLEGGEGEIDANRVASLIRGQMGGIRSCYERALRNNPTLAGRIDVRFTIGESGRITSINSSGLSEAPEVGSCVSGAIRRIAFPQPSGGSVDFSFPFTFSPGG